MGSTSGIDEICLIEGDDDLHEYGGAHGNKGNDFARFWLINELVNLATAGATDYLFILEYVQDVARLDVEADPTQITLYQLKKKEGGTWDLNSLAGLTQRGKTVKADSPLAKLLKAVLSFKASTARAEFVSNTRYKVDLEGGGTALSMDHVSLEELTNERRVQIRESTAAVHGIEPDGVLLERVSLRYAPIEVNDMRAHVIGTAHGLLKKLSAAHAAQADAFVDALFAKLATASRHTSKCKTFEELISKRGYSKKQFEEALGTLQLLTDQDHRRRELLKTLAEAFNWHMRDEMKVEVALAELSRLKLIGNEGPLLNVHRGEILKLSKDAEAAGASPADEFIPIEAYLTAALPHEIPPRVRALAIYTMVEIWTSQTFA